IPPITKTLPTCTGIWPMTLKCLVRLELWNLLGSVKSKSTETIRLFSSRISGIRPMACIALYRMLEEPIHGYCHSKSSIKYWTTDALQFQFMGTCPEYESVWSWSTSGGSETGWRRPLLCSELYKTLARPEYAD